MIETTVGAIKLGLSLCYILENKMDLQHPSSSPSGTELNQSEQQNDVSWLTASNIWREKWQLGHKTYDIWRSRHQSLLPKPKSTAPLSVYEGIYDYQAVGWSENKSSVEHRITGLINENWRQQNTQRGFHCITTPGCHTKETSCCHVTSCPWRRWTTRARAGFIGWRWPEVYWEYGAAGEEWSQQ